MTSASSWEKSSIAPCTMPAASGSPLASSVVELLLANFLARLVAERIVAGLAQRLAPVLDDVAEGALAGAVADEAFVVLQLDVVAVDLDGGQRDAPCVGNGRQGRASVSHGTFPVSKSRQPQRPEKFHRAATASGHGAARRFTMSMARRIRVIEASSVRKAAWADSVTFSNRPGDDPALSGSA